MDKRFLFLIILIVIFAFVWFASQGKEQEEPDDEPTVTNGAITTTPPSGPVISNIAKQYDRKFVRYQDKNGAWLMTDWIQDGRRYHWTAQTSDADFAWTRGSENKLTLNEIGNIEKGLDYNKLPI